MICYKQFRLLAKRDLKSLSKVSSSCFVIIGTRLTCAYNLVCYMYLHVHEFTCHVHEHIVGDPVDFLSWFLNTLHFALCAGDRKGESIVHETFLGEMKIYARKLPPPTDVMILVIRSLRCVLGTCTSFYITDRRRKIRIFKKRGIPGYA